MENRTNYHVDYMTLTAAECDSYHYCNVVICNFYCCLQVVCVLAPCIVTLIVTLIHYCYTYIYSIQIFAAVDLLQSSVYQTFSTPC